MSLCSLTLCYFLGRKLCLKPYYQLFDFDMVLSRVYFSIANILKKTYILLFKCTIKPNVHINLKLDRNNIAELILPLKHWLNHFWAQFFISIPPENVRKPNASMPGHLWECQNLPENVRTPLEGCYCGCNELTFLMKTFMNHFVDKNWRVPEVFRKKRCS